MPKFTYDCRINAAFTIEADTPEAGALALEGVIDCATVNCGALPNGDPLIGEASLAGAPALAMIDGVDVSPDSDEAWIACANSHYAEFTLNDAFYSVRDTQEESWRVDASDRCTTKAEAARAYCQDFGCEP